MKGHDIRVVWPAHGSSRHLTAPVAWHPEVAEMPMRTLDFADHRPLLEKSLAEQQVDHSLVRVATGAGDYVTILRLISDQSGCLPDKRSAVRTRLVPAG
ncbi:hypothetical protein [Amycolatopsis palatopharyngis]|uniref:hypothetical protein n=1 Tax=Amycolatopsis palatopharyngis TaxID=187982 RepID=UPI000E24CB38|nr:hypothetical protein [Amycolatopsis palatopharyngis]